MDFPRAYIFPSCRNPTDFYTSSLCGSSQSYHFIVYTMRACGQGYSGIEKFTTFTNMPKPMTQNNYDKLINVVRSSVKVAAQESMRKN